MSSDYANEEKAFLNDMADQFGFFKPNDRLAFIQRLLNSNSDLSNESLADVLDASFVKRNPDADSVRMFTDRWQKIYKVLETKHSYSGEKNWQAVKQWLKDIHYPIWKGKQNPPTLLTVWQNLWEKASHYSAFQVKLYEPNKAPTEATLDIRRGGNKPTEDMTKIKVDSPIYYTLSLENSSYVIVLEKFISEKIACLCPSIDQKQLHFPEKRVIIPDPNNEKDYQYFWIDDTTGESNLLAILSPKQPNFDWLKPKDDDFHYLTPVELNELLTYINQEKDINLLKMAYKIIP